MQDERRRIGIVAAIAAIALLLLAALTIALLPGRIEDQVAAAVAAALKGGPFDGIAASVSGRSVMLTGTASDDAQRTAAVAAIAALPSVGGVIDQIASPGPAAKPSTYRFTAVWDGHRLALGGFMPSRDQREEIAVHGRDTLPAADVDNAVEVAPGPPDPNWLSIAEAGIAAMKPLTSASLTMAGTQVDFSGAAATEAARDAATDILGRLPAPYEARINIAIGGAASQAAPGTAATPTGNAPPGPSYPFGMAYDGTSVALSGAVPSAAVKATLLAAIKQAAPAATVADRTRIDPAEPDAGWGDAVALLLGQLGRTRSAMLTGDGRALAFEIMAPTADAKAALLKAMGDLPAAYRLTLDMTVQTVAGADHQAIGGSGSPAYDCQTAANDALAKGGVGFVAASAKLLPAADAAIAQLATIAASCPKARLQITGHTDASGKPADNLKLSQQRADAVEAAIIAKGVAVQRLSAKGFGADRPIAPNTTDAGKARNRRIEVIVRP